MCIIAYHKPGAHLPYRKVLKQCFDSNPDGAGFMYYDGEVWQAQKGFMSFNPLWKAYKKEKLTAADTFAFHFRIATAGTIIKGNTHPFPISESVTDLKSLRFTTDKILMHNGVLGQGDPLYDLSDTQVFTADFMTNIIDFIKHDKIQDAIEYAVVGSRLLVGTENGNVYTFGCWHVDKKTGMEFSNNHYKPYKKSYKKSKTNGWLLPISDKGCWESSDGMDRVTFTEEEEEEKEYVKRCPYCDATDEVYNYSKDEHICDICGAIFGSNDTSAGLIE